VLQETSVCLEKMVIVKMALARPLPRTGEPEVVAVENMETPTEKEEMVAVHQALSPLRY